MTDYIGAWERSATIFLVDTMLDTESFTPLLEKLEDEHASIPTLANSPVVLQQFQQARQCLTDESGGKFLCMFVWNYSNQAYFPVCTDLFQDSDTEIIMKFVKSFVDCLVGCSCKGFTLKTLNDENKLLALAIQALCENEIMQLNLSKYETNSNDK